MDVGSSVPRNLRCEASEVEGQAATGRGCLSGWQAERRLRRRGAAGAEPGRSGALACFPFGALLPVSRVPLRPD